LKIAALNGHKRDGVSRREERDLARKIDNPEMRLIPT